MATSVFLNNPDIGRQEIKAAIAKSVELRALHAALLQGNSPASLTLQGCPSPSGSLCSNQFSAQDYPVFTPRYEEETLAGYHQNLLNNRRLLQNWDYVSRKKEVEDDETELSDAKKENQLSRNGFSPCFHNREHRNCSMEDHRFNSGSSVDRISVLGTSPAIMTCNRCRPATITRENDNNKKKNKNKKKSQNIVVPIADSQSSLQTTVKNKDPFFSWLIPGLKKQSKMKPSPEKPESMDVSQFSKEWGMVSLESLKKKLIEANEHRDAALMEMAEMKSSMRELKQKLVILEDYCKDLKKALKQTVQEKETQVAERLNLTKQRKSMEITMDNSMPVSHEAMVEGFLQVVSEARLSVTQFCRSLAVQIEENCDNLMEKLGSLLGPYNLTVNSKSSKGIFYHLEALINQSLYQDFENCMFRKNGSPSVLDPQQDRRSKFASFVELRKLSWSEVLRKGTKYYSEDFSWFCDQKMSCIISMLNWSKPWPEQILQSFFVAAKCIWLLHLLAFSFSPPLSILRIDENRSFDHVYMEDILSHRQRSHAPSRVRIMVMPGFYVQDKVLRCMVLCRYRTVA